MEMKKVKIKSIAPKDKFSIVGKQGNLYTDSLEIGKSLVVLIEDRMLRTSEIQEIKETATEVEVATRNSVYMLEYLKED